MPYNRPDQLGFLGKSNLRYSGYYLTGFVENQKRYHYRLQLFPESPHNIISAINDREWQPIAFAVSVFHTRHAGQDLWFCIDGHDSNTTFHRPLLEAVDLYFKVNYNEQAVAKDEQTRQRSDKIFPVNQSFPVTAPIRPQLAWRALSQWDNPKDKRYILSLFREGRHYVPLADILAFRGRPKDLDVFFVSSYYLQKHFKDNEFRYEIINRIRQEHQLRCLTGLSGRRHIGSDEVPSRYVPILLPRQGYSGYLNNISRSNVIVYTRGVHRCLSERFSLFLGLGLAVVGETLINNTDRLYSFDFIREQFAHEDPIDIAEHAIALAHNKGRAEELGRLNAKLFDTEFAPASVTKNILRQIGYH